MEALPELIQAAQAAIASAGDPAALDLVRVHYLGKKGVLTERLKEALGLIEVRVLDHFIVGDGEPLSMAEFGWV